MSKIIQIADIEDSIFVLTDEGKIFKRVHTTMGKNYTYWEEIESPIKDE